MAPREREIVVKTASSSTSLSSAADPDGPPRLQAPILAATRHLLRPNGTIVGREIMQAIRLNYTTFCSAIPTHLPPRPALSSIDGRAPITHDRVQDFILDDFGPALHQLGFGRGHRIALVLPNGPELALAIVATAHWASCVPLSATGAASELEADLAKCGADVIIGPYTGPLAAAPATVMDQSTYVLKNDQDWQVFRPLEDSAKRLGIPYVGLVPSPREAGVFRLVAHRTSTPLKYEDVVDNATLRQGVVNTTPNEYDDEVLVLFTSGTTGNKKLVPHQLGDMLTAAVTIALSWDLMPGDVNCNLMPLFHVGGIVRQVFSPLVSGSCVICCPSFDPSLFWALLAKKAFNWYYAAPTMHQMILQTHDEAECPAPRLRMIANAAGGLLPSLAVQMRQRFGAFVLPSYGMTECMPISSPPSNYELTKPGTSGVPVGPEVAILNLATMQPLPPRAEGPICVRGEPCFRGYGVIANDPSGQVPDTFLKDGWFNTGDLGFLDEDGYLYITGRSKEVINRGGEIISPMEVEEAVMSHGDVLCCAAFSALHNVLQEVVGIVIVMKKDRPRLDLPSLHEFLGERLAAPKWPQCLVFLDGLPKSGTNKVLRVKLNERFGLEELSDNMSPLERTFEGQCPRQGAPLTDPIPVTRVQVQAPQVQSQLAAALIQNPAQQQLWVVDNPKRAGSLVCHVYEMDRLEVIKYARATLDRYAVPTHVVQLTRPVSSAQELAAPTAMDAAATILQNVSSSNAPKDPTVQAVQELFVELLNLDYLPGPDGNFFHMGGSSMLASQLASKVRKRFEVPCSGADIFHHASSNDLAKLIKRCSEDNATAATDDTSTDSKSVSDQGAPFPPNRLAPENTLGAWLFQLVPMFILYPIWQVTRYLLFFSLLLRSVELTPIERDIWTFVAAYLIFHMIWITITPMVFVALKWLVIGRYRAGRYPIWSSYYLRWWFVDICRKVFLRGIWGSNEVFLNFYYRLLGAKIGKGARISLECDVAEYDLITVGDHAAVEFSTLRGFGVDNGAMILGPVGVGNHASLGVRSVVAPYTMIPDGGHLAPATCSYEGGKALDPKNARVNRRCMAEPGLLIQMFIGGPITFLVNAVGQIPPLSILYMMLKYKGQRGEVFEDLSDLMKWLCDPGRIKFYIGIRLARALLTPFFYMAAAIFVKKVLIGKFKPGPRDTNSQWQLMRHYLAATLFSRKKVQAVTDIIGRHYELVSRLYRLLGAKVGKRVFWPGRQPVFSGEFDLLEIGDDVVFGSRSCIFCITVDSCEKVTLCAGANVADNCVVLPGSIVSKNAVLGSNSLCPENWYLPQSSVWLGSKGSEPTCLEKGIEGGNGPVPSYKIDRSKLEMVGDASTLRPFGKAVYMRKAPYFVWPVSWIIVASWIIKAFITAFHTLPLLGALHGAAAVLYGWDIKHRNYQGVHYHFYQIYMAVLYVFIWTNMVRVMLWLVIELTAKWTIMGRRAVGRYNYDQTSYGQRWELYQLIAKIRKFSRLNFLQFFSGTPYMSLYFKWNGGTVGKDCCLYPAGADPFMPEPDLVVLGDRCVLDCAAVVCHLNTRGNFELAQIVMENDCTLRTRSRIQQGVHMERMSQLLEKSMVLTGEVVEAGSVWQGAPASWWFQYPTKSVVPFAVDEEEEEQLNNNNSEMTKLLPNKGSYYHA